MSFADRLQHAWNVFMNKDPTPQYNIGTAFSYRPDRPRFTRGNERSIVNSVYNRISMDAAELSIKHVKLDDDDRYVETVDSGLNNCLNLSANIDQTGRALRLDIFMSLLDEGCVAIVPIDTTADIRETDSFGIETMRVGKVIQWYPKDVRVRVYNESTGNREDVTIPKSKVAIVENPFYSIMNEPNGTMQRLIRKMNILDAIDDQSGAGKLDLIIQLPYTIRTQAKREQAELRRKDIEAQLAGSKYGIAYTEATEHVTQLNRSVDNNLMKQIEYLTNLLFSQLGITQEILNGTADANTMTNYYNRVIEPLVSAVVDEMKRKFLTKTARTKKQSIRFFRNPFKLVSITDLAELSDKLTRNEIMTPNEVRQELGMKPSSDPKADELRNRNISEASGSDQPASEHPEYETYDDTTQ